jgi:23S rRNA (cytosine1962-C5)-methyltransferase
MIKLLTPANWVDYELIDTGHYKKLERFGQYILSRPEPQAIWDTKLSEREWENLSHAVYTRRKGEKGELSDDDRGEWTRKPGMPEQWKISYSLGSVKLIFRLGLTAFKHVGVFPEQAVNWQYLYDSIIAKRSDDFRLLNLFAYTGGSSLAACAAGASVTHIDSVKQVNGWARENMEISGLNGIRWIIDDALKFVKREVRRGNKYHAVLLDPPAYGRGPEGEKWVLQSGLNELLQDCKQLLHETDSFILLNLYSVGYSAMVAESLVNTIFFPHTGEMQELYLTDRGGRKLPLGIVYLLNL